jgi:DNA invertase Pin-like site-specific DNA recombinase
MKYIGYVRVSTGKQGRSGLGLEGQEAAILSHVSSMAGELVALYKEVESGKKDDRPILLEAIAHAQLIGAHLVIHKLDRLSRDLGFITQLQKSDLDFTVVDLPGADRFVIHLFGAMAEKERSMISDRTKRALQAAKNRGAVLGNAKGYQFKEGVQEAGAVAAGKAHSKRADLLASRVLPLIERFQAEGKSLRGIAAELNGKGIPTPRGKEWTAQAVKNAQGRV